MALISPFDFRDKTILLTGATGGLGRPVSLAFAQYGGNLAIFDINEQGLSSLSRDIDVLGAQVFASRVDLCSQEEVENSIELVVKRFNKIDVLVNLVGGIIRCDSINYSIQDWQKVLDINLKACWLCCQEVGKRMIKQKNGCIINFASNAALHGNKGYPAYGPAKGGVIALTRVLAVEWGPYGVRTNAVAPGFIDTPINDELLSDPGTVERILSRVPLGRILPPDAVVGPTLFLASDLASWVNGHTLHVDGGFNIT
jgi:2-dehydro-3-deoxy-D-gluconate 5-dehydrogenase